MRKPSPQILIIAIIMVAIFFANGGEVGVTHARRSESFTLVSSAPTNSDVGIVLLDVETNGITRIRVASTGAILAAKPGEYIVSKEFGREGLLLKSASFTAQTASFIHVTCSPGTRTNDDIMVEIH